MKNIDLEKDKLYITNYRNSLTDIKKRKKLNRLSNNNLYLTYIKDEFNKNIVNNVINKNNNEELIINLIYLLKKNI